MPKRKRKIEGTPETAAATAVSGEDDTELIAVITAAIAAAGAAEAPVPVVTAVREAKAPVPVTGAAREPEIPAAATTAAPEEETQHHADSFTARTIKRRGRRK